jgi:hypothetical protein
MSLPTPDAYNDAVQTPRLAFLDPVLASGMVDCNGFGIPKALGGGFAITYRVNAHGRAFAVRCFHKEVLDIQDRYRLIHQGLRSAGLPAFVDFEYQQRGINVRGGSYPIVKMEWVAATTLGEYVEAQHGNRQAMDRLRAQFRELEQDLRRCGLAHGDLQNGNVLVEQRKLRLVDYDGMFVPGMSLGKGNELGHKHFQHPLRRAADFGPEVDRFSFIVIDLSLWAVSLRPELFRQFSSGENILFSANDFADPDTSRVFQAMAQIGDPAFRQCLADFVAVCKADFNSIPRLDDFLNRTAIPKAAAPPSAAAPDIAVYIAALPVVDAGSFEAVCLHIGDRVELIGQVVEVKPGTTRKGAPYVWVNFRDWRANCVRATIWSEGLKALGYAPDPTWVGQWLSINGMIDPVYHGKNRYKTVSYVSVGPTVTDRSQIHRIPQEEALWRLGRGPRKGEVAGRQQPKPSSRNAAVLARLSGGSKPTAPSWPASTKPPRVAGASAPRGKAMPAGPTQTSGASPVKTHNEQVLQKIGAGASSAGGSTALPPAKPEPKGCAKWVAMLLGSVLLILTYLFS